MKNSEGSFRKNCGMTEDWPSRLLTPIPRLVRISTIPRVVKIRRQGGQIVVDCDIYIGNPVRMGGWNLDYGKWANPYSLSKYGKDRKRQIDEQRLNAIYEIHVRSSPELMASLVELRGKILGCWCSPGICHGDVLVKLYMEAFVSDAN